MFGLKLCCCCLEILNSFFTRGLKFSFNTGSPFTRGHKFSFLFTDYVASPVDGALTTRLFSSLADVKTEVS